MSLRIRLIAGVLAVVAAAALAGDAATYSLLKEFFEQKADEQIEETQVPAASALGLGPGPRADGVPPPGVRPPPMYGELRDAEGRRVRSVSVGFDGAVPRPVLPEGFEPPPGGEDRRLTVPAAGASDARYRVSVRRVTEGRLLIVAVPIAYEDETLERLAGIERTVSFLVLLVAGGLAWLVVRFALRPLDRIAATAGEIAEGDLSRRIATTNRRTEVGRLGIALNAMLGHIERAFAAQAATEARLRRFVADASHELRTPLTSIRGHAELFRRGASERPADLARSMRRIEEAGARMSSLVDDLLLLAKLDEARPLDTEETDLRDVGEEAVAEARAIEPQRRIELEAPEPAIVVGDRMQLHQLVANLLANVRAHTPESAPARVSVGSDGAEAVLRVADEGPGMTEEQVAHAFERFYRADPSRARDSGSSGLGLAIVAAVAEAHGGRVEASSTLGAGTVVEVGLPLAASSPVSREATQVSSDETAPGAAAL